VRVLIADDEAVARKVLRELIEDLPGVFIAGEASTGAEAVAQIHESRPDVVLLDLEMPGMDGLEVARLRKPDQPPVVIFVTAYQKHALDAFDAGAVDYLLKPVRRERLEAALGKARSQLMGLGSPHALPAQTALRKIAGRRGGELHLFDLAKVIAFQAEKDDVFIVTAGGRYYANRALKAIEERLPKDRFLRVHRGTIINADHIKRISPLSSKRWLLRMSNGLQVVVSKRLASVIRGETAL
jgi:DNA-binding LytR/AlgR family response regulator